MSVRRERTRAGTPAPKLVLAGVLVLLGFGAALLVSRPAVATIIGSAHDLSAGTGGGGASGVKAATEDEICIFCHTPHNASPVAPLWNRSLSAQTYTLPDTTLWTYLLTTPIQPDGDSRLCLSCHDGTIAIGEVLNLGGLPGTISMIGVGVGGAMPAGAANLGTDLSGSHPVSIPYNDPLVTAKQVQCGAGNTWKLDTVANVMASPLVLRPTANTYGGQGGNGVQCTTCHDPHEPGAGFFLRVGSTQPDMGPGGPGANIDALCSTCHVSCP